MFEKILVPLDGSWVAEHVVPYAVLLGKRLNSPVVITTVVDTRELPTAHDENAARLIEMQRGSGHDYLNRMRQQFEREGIATTIEAVVGPAADAIVQAASSHKAGLIAMATHGRSGVDRWRLGSVSDRVLRTASVPVLLVRPPEAQSAARVAAPTIQHILLPLDGSERSASAVPAATFLAKAFSVPVTVMRTVSFTWYAAETGASPYDGMDGEAAQDILTALEDEARGYAEGVANQLRKDGIEARISISHANPGAAITDLAAATPGSVVVMSTHGRSGLGRTLLGSVTDHVIRSSLSPVLVVRGHA